MPFHTTPLTTTHAHAAAELDKKWFGEHAITATDLTTFIENHPHHAIGLFADHKLHGFATFEVLEHRLPSNYVGEISPWLSSNVAQNNFPSNNTSSCLSTDI